MKILWRFLFLCALNQLLQVDCQTLNLKRCREIVIQPFVGRIHYLIRDKLGKRAAPVLSDDGLKCMKEFGSNVCEDGCTEVWNKKIQEYQEFIRDRLLRYPNRCQDICRPLINMVKSSTFSIS